MKKTIGISVLIIVVAALYHHEVNTEYWTSVQSTSVDAKLEDVFKFMTDHEQVEKWFKWVSHLRPVDSKPMAAKKKFHAVYDIPVFGEYLVLCKLVEYIPKHKIVMESKWLFQPRFELHMYQAQPKETRMTLKMGYKRKSLMFHIFFAPLLSYVTDQQMQRSLFLIRSMFPMAP